VGLQFFILAAILGIGAVGFSMHGQGGGVLYTPIQVLFGVDFHEAVVRSQWFTIVTSLSAVLVFRKAGKVDWKLAFVLESTSFVGAFTSGYFARSFSATALTIVLAALVTCAAIAMLKDVDPPVGLVKEKPWHWMRTFGSAHYRVNLAAGLPLSFLIGITAGLTGAAGGFLKIPMMVRLFGVPIDVAFGSSAFMVCLTAAGGLTGQIAAGSIDWLQMFALSAFVAIGAQIGPHLTLRVSQREMTRRFAYYLFFIAAAVVATLWIKLPL
jgi:uncharacterized membrane protein YfcA